MRKRLRSNAPNHNKAKKLCREIIKNNQSFYKQALYTNIPTIVLTVRKLVNEQDLITDEIKETIRQQLNNNQNRNLFAIAAPFLPINFTIPMGLKMTQALKSTFSRESAILQKICKIETTHLIHKITDLPFDMCNMIDCYSNTTEETTQKEQSEREGQPYKLSF